MSERVDQGSRREEEVPDKDSADEPKDDVDEQSEESFPASDPPSY